jgi:hypothetical protein
MAFAMDDWEMDQEPSAKIQTQKLWNQNAET